TRVQTCALPISPTKRRHVPCYFANMILITTVFRRLRGLGLALATTAALQIPAVAGAAAQTLPEHLIGATEAFLEEQVANYLQRASIGGRYEIQVNRLDSRLRMPACDQPLVASLE